MGEDSSKTVFFKLVHLLNISLLCIFLLGLINLILGWFIEPKVILNEFNVYELSQSDVSHYVIEKYIHLLTVQWHIIAICGMVMIFITIINGILNYCIHVLLHNDIYNIIKLKILQIIMYFVQGIIALFLLWMSFASGWFNIYRYSFISALKPSDDIKSNIHSIMDVLSDRWFSLQIISAILLGLIIVSLFFSIWNLFIARKIILKSPLEIQKSFKTTNNILNNNDLL